MALCVRQGGFLEWGRKGNERGALRGILYRISLIGKHRNDGLGGEPDEKRGENHGEG